MAALPLTMDMLQTPHTAEPQSTLTPNERPSALTLDGPQQQHSNVTPTSTSAYGNISPALSSVGSLSPSFLPEMPQWKRDLIQRRKQNVQRASPTAAPSSSSSPLSSPSIIQVHGLKTSTSSSSMRSLAGSNTTNIDQVASDGLYSPTKDFNKLSSLSSATTATKVNKQHATTTIPATIKSTSAAAAATGITSPSKEKTAKLFGGQYTATSTAATAAAATPTLEAATATVNTKEEITKDTMEEEYLDKSKKTKEYTTTTTTTATSNNTRTIKTVEKEEEEDVQNITTTTTTTTIKQQQQQQHQMATRLTGSSSYTSSSTTTSSTTTNNNTASSGALLGSKREFSGEREQHASGSSSGYQQQCYNITGANNGSANQSSSKCESERLVCAANNSGSGSSLLATTTTQTTSNVVKISQKLQQNQFIKNEQQHKTKIIKFKTTTVAAAASNINSDLKSPTKTATSSSPSSASASNNCAIKKKMVAMQEMKKSTQNTATHLHTINSTCSANANTAASNGNGRSSQRIGGGVASQNSNDLDSNEDLSYGPGIVSKLRCRYLSLALRESMEQQRLNKDLLRRSTSLNNLLDDDHDDNVEEDDEDNMMDNIGEEEEEQQKIEDNLSQKKAGILKNSCTAQEKRFSQGSNGVGVTFTETSFNKRSRHLKRGNDSLKRARSVEALLSEKSPWQGSHRTSTPTCVTIEDKIQNARERLHQGTDHMPPKRLTSIIDDTERPPPDLVKQTLKMFEASANRRPRCTNRSNSKGDVASKVETFKNIIKDQKPVVTYPKPVSPTKKLNTPPTLVKPLKSSDLLQTPLGRKAMAAANSHGGSDTMTGKSSTTNTLSEHTPDIIPRQKVHSERELNKEKCTMGINKEKFMHSLMEPPLSTTNVVDSTLKSTAKEKFLASMVDSPITALSKELENMKLTENSTPRKLDNSANDNNIARSHDDAFHNDDDQYKGNGEEITEMNTNEFSSLKSENDKIKQQINNEIQSNANAIATSPAHEATVKAHTAHSSSDLSDGEDDDEYGISTTKRITRTALDNIAKAGTTQQFKFSSTTHHSSSSSSNQHSTVAGKQIGVIRPLLNTSTTASTTSNTTQKVAAESITNMETLKHHSTPSLTSREIEKNRINDLKKSSSTSSPTSAASSPSASLDNVIKSTNATSTSSSSASPAASSYSEVDTVISATNSPLWAMRKRRQNPPAAPAENTSMVFNFSNRKEVPDYIESDGVIFRRKRELPKPNESGFVLLGDLSVETSTDMDYDDFSMCPPSPCDVEFVNANIVIDGKSSIRQKSKDTTFRVQFNDTLTSTFEYPSEASLIVEDSFTALSNDYPLPGESDFNQAFQNLVLESYAAASSDDANAIMPPLHHVADEIIQLPTTNESSSPANTTATKNILGNLPLDCPDLEKATPLTVVAMAAIQATSENNASHQIQNHNHNSNILNNNSSSCSDTPSQELPKSLEIRKSRKDLKLPLLEQQLSGLSKPLVPQKNYQMMTMTRKPSYLKASANPKQIESKVTSIPVPRADIMNIRKHLQEPVQLLQLHENIPKIRDPNDNVLYEDTINPVDQQKQKFSEYEQHVTKSEQRKIPRVLSKPQYACFLRQPEPVWQKSIHSSSVQRSRSNEFRKTSGTNFVTTTVLRSSSLRNLEKTLSPTSPFSATTSAATTTTTTVTTSLYFTPDVNSCKFLSKRVVRKAKDPANAQSPTNAEVDDLATKSVSLINLTNGNLNETYNVKMSGSEVIPSLSLSNLQQIPINNKELTENSVEIVDQLSSLLTNLENTSTVSLPNLNQATEETIGEHGLHSSIGTTEYSAKVSEQVTCSLPNLMKALNSTKDLTDSDSAEITADFNTNSNAIRTAYSPEILENMTLSLPNLTASTTNKHLNTYSTGIMINVSSSNAKMTGRSINDTQHATLSLPNLMQSAKSTNDLSVFKENNEKESIDEWSDSFSKIPETITKETSSSEETTGIHCRDLLTRDELSIDSLDDEYEDALNQQLDNIQNLNLNNGGVVKTNVELSKQTNERQERALNQLCEREQYEIPNEYKDSFKHDEYSYDLVINELPTKVATNFVESENNARKDIKTNDSSLLKSENVEIGKNSSNMSDLKLKEIPTEPVNLEPNSVTQNNNNLEEKSIDSKIINDKTIVKFDNINSKKDLENNEISIEDVSDVMNNLYEYPLESVDENCQNSISGPKHLLYGDFNMKNDTLNNEISSDIASGLRNPLVAQLYTRRNVSHETQSEKKINKVSINTTLGKPLNSSDDKKIGIFNRNSKFSGDLNSTDLSVNEVGSTKVNRISEKSVNIARKSLTKSAKLSSNTDGSTKPVHVMKIDNFDNFSNEASKDAGLYSTFASGRKCNRNISKSFTNALTLYESFSEKTKTTKVEKPNITGVQRTASLMENSLRSPKGFENSARLVNTNNFGNVFQTSSVGNLPSTEYAAEMNSNNAMTSLENNDKVTDYMYGNIAGETSTLKPPSQVFFNTSPRPFRRIYEQPTPAFINSPSMLDSSPKVPISPNIVPLGFRPPQTDSTLSLGSLTTPTESTATFNKVYSKFPFDFNALPVALPKPTSITCHTFINVSPNLPIDFKMSSVDTTKSSDTFCPTPDDPNKSNTNINSFQLPRTQLGAKAIHTTPTLPVKGRSTVTSADEVNALNTNIGCQVEGLSKPSNFLKTTNSCSSTSCSSSSTSCSSRITTSTTTNTITTTTMTKVHARAKCMQQSEIRSAIPPKVMPRRLFATATPPSIKTSNTSNNMTVTATSTINSSPSSISNSFKASSYTNSTTTTSSATLCAPPLRRRIPGNTLYYV